MNMNKSLSSSVSVWLAPLVLASGLLTLAPRTSMGEITYFDTVKFQSYLQTANGQLNPIPNGNTFISNVGQSAVGDYTSATLTAPGSVTPFAMNISGTFISYSQSFNTQAQMDATFGFGTYTADADGPAGPATSSLDYVADYYPGIPQLSGSNFSDLQQIDPSHDFALQWNPLIAGPDVSDSSIILRLFDSTDLAMIVTTSLAATDTSYLIGANSLVAGHDYGFTLEFANNVRASADRWLSFQQSTSGLFSVPLSAVPEPGTLAMTALGLAGLACRGRRRAKPRRPDTSRHS
jgi:hypothetical protein